MRILGVDDDLMARSMLFEALKLSGYGEVVLASSGQDGLRKIQLAESPFDCFLLDIQMDGIDGIQLCEQIRQMQEYAETPIIMVTGLSEKPYMEQAFKVGATDYITKPFDMMELGTRVKVAEKICQKIKEIAHSEAEISTLKSIVETLEIKKEIPSVEFATPGFMKQDVFENTLQQFSHSELIHSSLVKCQIANFGQISARCTEGNLQALLADVATAIGNVFDHHGLIATYGGQGTFVILFRHSPPSDQELIQVQENLNQIRLLDRTGYSEFVMLEFGEPIFSAQLSADDPLGADQDEKVGATSQIQSLDIVTGEVIGEQAGETPQQKLERRLKGMVPYYMSVLNDAMARLDEAYENLQKDDSTWSDFDSIERTAHKIAGVAPSLGFSELGAAAARTEKLAAQASSTNDFPKSCAAIQAPLGELLDRIEDTIVDNFAHAN